MRISAAALLFVAAASLVWTSTANAAFYGNYNGATVTFENVFDQNGLFGAPNDPAGLVDSLDFTPNAFEAECPLDPNCAGGILTIDDTLTLTIQADTGSVIDDVVFSEAGDVSLQSFIGATAAASVGATLFIDIFEIDGVAVNNVNHQAQLVFSNDAFESYDEGYGIYLWTGGITVDLDQVISDAGLTGRATRIQVNLDNTLTAFAASGATSRIEKKDVDGLTITVVPEPGTAVLMGLGLAGLASIRRRA